MLIVKDVILDTETISVKFDTVQDLVDHFIGLKFDLIVTNKPGRWTEIILCDHGTGKQYSTYLVADFERMGS